MKSLGFCSLVLFFLVPTGSLALGENLCSPINFCRVEKTTWGKKGWKSDYVKELAIPEFCSGERPLLQLEPELGIELWLFDKNKDSKDWLESQPRVVAHLFTYKPTYVVATGSAPASATSVAFSHRLRPKSPSFVKVACHKK